MFGDIIDAGVRVFFYLSDKEQTLNDEQDEIMLSLSSFGSAGERSKAVARARDKALALWQQGRNFGGRCYGYDNVWRMPDGSESIGTSQEYKPKIAQTVYRINARRKSSGPSTACMPTATAGRSSRTR